MLLLLLSAVLPQAVTTAQHTPFQRQPFNISDIRAGTRGLGGEVDEGGGGLASLLRLGGSEQHCNTCSAFLCAFTQPRIVSASSIQTQPHTTYRRPDWLKRHTHTAKYRWYAKAGGIITHDTNNKLLLMLPQATSTLNARL